MEKNTTEKAAMNKLAIGTGIFFLLGATAWGKGEMNKTLAEYCKWGLKCSLSSLPPDVPKPSITEAEAKCEEESSSDSITGKSPKVNALYEKCLAAQMSIGCSAMTKEFKEIPACKVFEDTMREEMDKAFKKL
jgi:hypothetical protein